MSLSFETTLRLLELGIALAILQRAAEHLNTERLLFSLQAIAAIALLLSLFRAQAVWALWLLSLWQLWVFQGPYNGGADKMALLMLTCLGAAHVVAVPFWQELAIAYLAVQVILSYVISGWVKLRNPDWRSGRALSDVFAFSAYPVAENLRALSERHILLKVGSWAVISLEIIFPLAFFHLPALILFLTLTAGFHLANALLFGLNRFFWIWISAYPALIWFQSRLS